MPISNYQLPTKLTFYPSILQYYYAAGLITNVHIDGVGNLDANDERVFRLLTVDPSNILELDCDTRGSISFITHHDTWTDNSEPMNLYNFNFGMFLGHDLKYSIENNNLIDLLPTLHYNNGTVSGGISDVGWVNWDSSAVQSLSYNGWSFFTTGATHEAQGLGFEWNSGSNIETKFNIGSFILGKKWEAPQNVDLSSGVNHSYPSKTKKTISGKTLSQMNYYKPQKWLLDAWELSAEESNTRNIETESRNGVRFWNVKWSMLADSKVLPQNAMQNSNFWIVDSDSEYSVGADGKSLYDGTQGPDFITSVLRVTMGSHLPLVVRISESYNNDQWAVVRITKYKITQKNPKLIDVQLTLEEQV